MAKPAKFAQLIQVITGGPVSIQMFKSLCMPNLKLGEKKIGKQFPKAKMLHEKPGAHHG